MGTYERAVFLFLCLKDFRWYLHFTVAAIMLKGLLVYLF